MIFQSTSDHSDPSESDSHFRGAVLRRSHPRPMFQSVTELLVDVESRIRWRPCVPQSPQTHTHTNPWTNLGNATSDHLVGMDERFPYPVRRSPRAGRRTTRRHSERWRLCRRWILETSTWEVNVPVNNKTTASTTKQRTSHDTWLMKTH